MGLLKSPKSENNRQYCCHRSNRRYKTGHPQWYRRRHRRGCTASGEVMLSDFTGAEKVHIYCGYTDLRHEIDGLSAIVRLDPLM